VPELSRTPPHYPRPLTQGQGTQCLSRGMVPPAFPVLQAPRPRGTRDTPRLSRGVRRIPARAVSRALRCSPGWPTAQREAPWHFPLRSLCTGADLMRADHRGDPPAGTGVNRACPRHGGTAEQARRPEGDDHRRLCRLARLRHRERPGWRTSSSSVIRSGL
jgi:hypothetical protein